MKLSTKRQELVDKLSVVSRVASNRAATQALSGVHVSASGGEVRLRATDLEMGIETALEAEVEGDGAVPAARPAALRGGSLAGGR